MLTCVKVSFGLLAGTLFPSIIALPQELGLSTTGRTVSIIVSLANIGNLVGPFVFGESMKVSTMALPWACLIAVVAMTGITLLALLYSDILTRTRSSVR